MISQQNIDTLLGINLLPPEDGFEKYDPFKLGQTVGIFDLLFPNVTIWCFPTIDKGLSLEYDLGQEREFFLEINTETKIAEFGLMDFPKGRPYIVVEEKVFKLPGEFNKLKKVVETYFPETKL